MQAQNKRIQELMAPVQHRRLKSVSLVSEWLPSLIKIGLLSEGFLAMIVMSYVLDFIIIIILLLTDCIP